VPRNSSQISVLLDICKLDAEVFAEPVIEKTIEWHALSEEFYSHRVVAKLLQGVVEHVSLA
jgi:hypothetical protein